jgi:putative transposase
MPVVCSPEVRPELIFESGYFQALGWREGHGTEGSIAGGDHFISAGSGGAAGSGRDGGQICRGLGISEQTYYKWRREYGGLKLDQAKRLKELERENERLKKAVSELTLDKLILKEALTGKY